MNTLTPQFKNANKVKLPPRIIIWNSLQKEIKIWYTNLQNILKCIVRLLASWHDDKYATLLFDPFSFARLRKQFQKVQLTLRCRTTKTCVSSVNNFKNNKDMLSNVWCFNKPYLQQVRDRNLFLHIVICIVHPIHFAETKIIQN